MAVRFSTREYAAFLGKGAPGYKKPSKYRNKRVVIDGIEFDSAREGEHYAELKLLERAGEITDLVLQPSFELVPAIKRSDGSVQRAVTYKADFMYEKDGKQVVEDAKGCKTKEYLIKKKLMLYVHGIEVIEV